MTASAPAGTGPNRPDRRSPSRRPSAARPAEAIIRPTAPSSDQRKGVSADPVLAADRPDSAPGHRDIHDVVGDSADQAGGRHNPGNDTMTGTAPSPGSCPPGRRIPRGDESDRIPALVRHLTYALSAHVRRLDQQGLTVPAELGFLVDFLLRAARIRLDSPMSAGIPETRQSAPMSDRLLLTKHEAAERLSVSVRTVERLASTGRLPQVHVERSARFRVTDLEAYVDSLRDNGSGYSDSESPPALTGSAD